MDDQTDDRNLGIRVGTPEELEEALKWLEDLTARQNGKTADVKSQSTSPNARFTISRPDRQRRW